MLSPSLGFCLFYSEDMNRLAFIYMISFALLCFLQGHQKYSYEKTPQFVQDKREELKSKFEKPEHAELLLSYVAGEYKKIPKEIKEAHKILGLNHLFTPSGIHLSALFLLFFPFLFWLKKSNRLGHFLFGSLLYLSPFVLLPTFSAAKRISLLRLLTLWKTLFPWQIPIFALFIGAFVLDIFLGGYSSSPGSWVYSFLFIGILFSCEKLPSLFVPLALWGGQLMISFFQQTPLTLVGFFLGFLLTALFTPFFPIYFAYFWTSPWLPAYWGEFFIKLYLHIVLLAAQLAQKSGLYFSSLPLVVMVIILSLKFPSKLKVLVVGLLLFFHSEPLLNAKKLQDLRSEKIMHYSPDHKAPSLNHISRT